MEVIANLAPRFGNNVPVTDYSLHYLTQVGPNGGFGENAYQFDLPGGTEFGPTAVAKNQAGVVAFFVYNVGWGHGEFPITVRFWFNDTGWAPPQMVIDSVAG